MTLAIVGAGMVSPRGTTVAEHVFLLRACVPAPPPSPFLRADDSTLHVEYCPWIGARAPMVERLPALAAVALAEAIKPLDDALGEGSHPLVLVQSRNRPGVGEDERRAIEQAVAKRARAKSIDRAWDDAGTFAAFGQAEALLASGEGRAVVLVALDSFVSTAALTAEVIRPRSPWSHATASFTEGCAAIIVVDDAFARQSGLRVLGRVHDSVVTVGTVTEDDDEVVDAIALTQAIRRLKPGEPARFVFGQSGIDGFRSREWDVCAARVYDHLHPACLFPSCEQEIGRLGAASGAMSVAFALAQIHHRAIADEQACRAPFLVWAISRDGTRGVSRITAGTT